MQMEDGRYAGKFTGECSIYENAKGSLVAAFGIEVEGQVKTWFATLVNPDGAVSTRRVADLKAMLGWDGADPSWLQEAAGEYAGRECEATIANESANDGNVYANIKYVDPPGGGTAKLPEGMDKRSILAKYGAKFRAVSGGAPAKPPARTAPPAMAKPTTAGPPPSKAPSARTQTASMEKCWAAICKAEDGKPREEVEATWFAIVEEAVPGKNAADFTPADWGAVEAKIEAMIDARDDIPME